MSLMLKLLDKNSNTDKNLVKVQSMLNSFRYEYAKMEIFSP